VIESFRHFSMRRSSEIDAQTSRPARAITMSAVYVFGVEDGRSPLRQVMYYQCHLGSTHALG
jgi:hypothetical protein